MQLDSEEDPSLQQEQGRSLLGSHLTFLSAAPSGLPPVLEFDTPGHHTQEASSCSNVNTPYMYALASFPCGPACYAAA